MFHRSITKCTFKNNTTRWFFQANSKTNLLGISLKHRMKMVWICYLWFFFEKQWHFLIFSSILFISMLLKFIFDTLCYDTLKFPLYIDSVKKKFDNINQFQSTHIQNLSIELSWDYWILNSWHIPDRDI